MCLIFPMKPILLNPLYWIRKKVVRERAKAVFTSAVTGRNPHIPRELEISKKMNRVPT